MSYYVYIIQSQLDFSYYKGYSENPLLRLHQHNNKECNYTSNKTPWALVYIEEMTSKTGALIREKRFVIFLPLEDSETPKTAKSCVDMGTMDLLHYNNQ